MARQARSPHLASIEACRGIAAVMVLCCHSSVVLSAPADFGFRPFGPFFLFGRSGVDFFFVLSGFLISLLHSRDFGQPDRLAQYALRRVTRIYPTYWLVLIALVPFDIFTHTLFDNYNQPWEVLKSVFLLPQAHTIIDVTWSLRNELLFYALFGLAIFSRAAGAIVGAAWAVGLVARQIAGHPPQNAWLDLATDPMNFEFLTGVVAGWAFRRQADSGGKIPRPALLLTVGIAGFIALWAGEDLLGWTYLPPHQLALRCVAYGFAAALTIVGLSALELDGRVKVPAPIVVLGGASYLLYLIHVPALLVLGASERHLHLLRFAPGWTIAGFFILSIVAVAVAVHLLVEKPMLRAIRGRPARQPPAAPSPAAI